MVNISLQYRRKPELTIMMPFTRKSITLIVICKLPQHVTAIIMNYHCKWFRLDMPIFSKRCVTVLCALSTTHVYPPRYRYTSHAHVCQGSAVIATHPMAKTWSQRGACYSQPVSPQPMYNYPYIHPPHATVGRVRLEHIDSGTLTVTAALFSACSETMTMKTRPHCQGAANGVHRGACTPKTSPKSKVCVLWVQFPGSSRSFHPTMYYWRSSDNGILFCIAPCAVTSTGI